MTLQAIQYISKRPALSYVLRFVAVAGLYVLLARFGLSLASINPSASPIWPPAGLALASVLLGGYGMAPAILLGAFVANQWTTGVLAASAAIAVGNTLEALVGAYLINRWTGGHRTFDSPQRVMGFVLIVLGPSTILSATIGVTSLCLTGLEQWSAYGAVWFTWWMGDFAGALVVAPLFVVWSRRSLYVSARVDYVSIAVALSMAVLVGLFAFSPLFAQTPQRGALAFLAVLPLVYAALSCTQRETVTAVFLLAGFAVWGTIAGVGPFAQSTLNDSFLMQLMFIVSTAVPSLMLSADVAVRRESLERQKLLVAELNHRARNLLAVIHAIATHTLGDPRGAERARDSFIERLMTLSRTYGLLSETAMSGARLSQIMELELAGFDGRVRFEGNDLLLSPTGAQNFALALHELVTNAGKYGAFSVPGGTVSIRCAEVNEPGRGRRIIFSWSEENGPSVDAPSRNGFGQRLLERLFEGAKFEFNREGLVYRFDSAIEPLCRADKASAG